MDEYDINSLDTSGAAAPDSNSGFWQGLGQSLGTGLSTVANNALNGTANKTTATTPTTQTAQASLGGINTSWLLIGGVAVIGLFAVIALSSARR